MPRTVAERADVIPVLAEIFRLHGFEGTSLSLIGEKTGLGKGSLYHFFPGGKEEMADAVLAEIADWFENHVYKPLRETDDPRRAIDDMCRSVADYFRSGRQVCLVGAFALDNVRDRFLQRVHDYFAEWTIALAGALERLGHDARSARDLAEEAVLSIQGALVLARALDDPAVFDRALSRVRDKLSARQGGIWKTGAGL